MVWPWRKWMRVSQKDVYILEQNGCKKRMCESEFSQKDVHSRAEWMQKWMRVNQKTYIKATTEWMSEFTKITYTLEQSGCKNKIDEK